MRKMRKMRIKMRGVSKAATDWVRNCTHKAAAGENYIAYFDSSKCTLLSNYLI